MIWRGENLIGGYPFESGRSIVCAIAFHIRGLGFPFALYYIPFVLGI